jgi:uncharacterized membrane protein
VADAAGERRPTAPRVYERGGEEFVRVVTFSDGVFAIAMTLLVVEIAIPHLRHGGDEGELGRALGDLIPSFISFAISFAVIGRYWFAHHDFFARLRAVDARLIAINLVYLGFIAFLPFPTGLLGNYFENALSVAVYAAAVAAVSGLEVVLFRRAFHAGLLRHAMPLEVYQWGTLQSTAPVVCFVASVPVAFVSTAAAVAVWFLSVPIGIELNRRKPAEADEYRA